MTFDPKSVEVICVTLPKDHCVQVPWKYIKVCGYSDPFIKNLNQRSLILRCTLTPHLLRSHVWLYPRNTVSKSHGNTSMYVDTVINFGNTTHTTYYILSTTYIPVLHRMSDHIVSFWTQFRRDKNGRLSLLFTPLHWDLFKVAKSQNLVPAKFWRIWIKKTSATYSCFEEQKGQVGIRVLVSKALECWLI